MKFDPKGSTVSMATMTAFTECLVSPDLLAVPGIGPVTKTNLMEKDTIDNTFQLIGVFLRLKGGDMNMVQHTEAFAYYLESCGVSNSNHRNSIVLAIAEKVNTLFNGSGLFNPDEYSQVLEQMKAQEESDEVIAEEEEQ
ncbi:Hypothetical Protein FCC1311_006582 [Hondaea fermentalgiana]|uniref:Uncharacterized protein n=1 Tax=Hondaea fermentalgiana TaxID=2315210 RepID=A0A2R5G0B9_9STRA|nr:Hypothetical Protein FCC1311_006582 [Hondaea fermentalgiana]|eukprot:GBG24440.1 Hypothetical Protein FCC1311_006582 [Hondaea fermentalgiana]